MKKFVKLIAAVLMAAVLVFSLCVGLSAASGSHDDDVVSVGCSYYLEQGTGRYQWHASMWCGQSYTYYDLFWSGAYSGSGYSGAYSSSIVGDNYTYVQPSEWAYWSWDSPYYLTADDDAIYIS